MNIYDKKNFLNHGVWFVFQHPLPVKERNKKFLILFLIFLLPFLYESSAWFYPKTSAKIVGGHEVKTQKGTHYVPVLAMFIQGQEQLYPMKATEYYFSLENHQVGDMVQVSYRLNTHNEIKSVTILSFVNVYTLTTLVVGLYLAVLFWIGLCRYLMLDRHRWRLARLQKRLKNLKPQATQVSAVVRKVHELHAAELNGIHYKEIYLDVYYFDQQHWREYAFQTYRFYVRNDFHFRSHQIELYIKPNHPEKFMLDIDDFITKNSISLNQVTN